MGKCRDMDAFIALQGQGLGIRIGHFMKFILSRNSIPKAYACNPSQYLPVSSSF